MKTPFERALEHIRRQANGGPIPAGLTVTMNFHPDTMISGITMIDLLAEDGSYRSQFETGTSNGGITAHKGGDRWNWESRMFGEAYDEASPALRPKYGTLNHRQDPAGGSPRFGSCHLRLRPKMLLGTSFCYPDSHLEPRHFGTAESAAPLLVLAEANPRGLDPVLDNYVEAHVHGPLSIGEDVEAVVLDPSYQDTSVEAAAIRLGCPVEWHDGFRLHLSHLAECAAFRGAATAAAVVAIAEQDIVTPVLLGKAREQRLDYQTAKWVWHCVARYGREQHVTG